MRPPARTSSPDRLALAPRMVGLALSLTVLYTIGLVVLLGGVSRVDAVCRPCHAMRPYASMLAVSDHASTRCVSCHSSEGAAGVVSDGLAMGRRVVGSVLGRLPEPTSHVSETSCRDCHSDEMRRVVSSERSIAVRHSDFADKACAECHGGVAHRITARVYAAPLMEDCTGCHRVSYLNSEVCGTCHLTDWFAGSSLTQSTWRVTHGPEWRTTHGMGDLSRCVICHPRDYCVDCHGTAIPHPGWWSSGHGSGLQDQTRAECQKCHAPTWCGECHGIEMPHPPAFVEDHATIGRQTGQALCLRCHVSSACESCHALAEHPDVPDVERRHKR